ncbi:MAG: nucleoside-diphosphate sugar epimerase/dehydratase [Proteobacteria bacterium]|nr:nucleoside-diphosphate sugar epimerase/dehydratase [Pseudomonadota bacterium]
MIIRDGTFIDDDPALQNTLIGGLRGFAPSDVKWLTEQMLINSVLLAMPGLSRARRREIIGQIAPLGLEIKTIPGIADVISGRASVSELRRVSPEDLLGRDPVPPRAALMGRNITGKVVLVSGAGGSIGSELCRQIIQHDPAALVLFELSEFALYSITAELRETLARDGKSVRIEPILGSVQNEGRVRSVLRAFGVQTIYHAAAYKHVVLVEENVVDGIVNNVFGTKVLAEAAIAQGVENFILISTDKAVRPTNFMGASKRMAELVCQAMAAEQSRTTFSMVRFGNVLGSSGSVIPRFRKQIEHGGPVTVTHREITRFFMTIPEASQLVIQAGAMARGGDVFVLDMGDPVKILELAQSMIRLHGLKPYIIDQAEEAEPARGDIAIQIVGLNKGEKLYEELLIGNNPKGTDHPRIMTATEVSLRMDQLGGFLDRLQRGCAAYEIEAVRQIFLEAPLAYQPTEAGLHDLTWNATGRDRLGNAPALRVVNPTA